VIFGGIQNISTGKGLGFVRTTQLCHRMGDVV
jgi:hypothetical protein